MRPAKRLAVSSQMIASPTVCGFPSCEIEFSLSQRPQVRQSLPLRPWPVKSVQSIPQLAGGWRPLIQLLAELICNPLSVIAVPNDIRRDENQKFGFSGARRLRAK